MISSILPQIAIAVVALAGARLSDLALRSLPAAPCTMLEKSPVVWAYEPTDDTMLGSCPDSSTRRSVSPHRL